MRSPPLPRLAIVLCIAGCSTQSVDERADEGGTSQPDGGAIRQADSGITGRADGGTLQDGASTPCAPAERCIAHMAEWRMPGSATGGEQVPFDYAGLADEAHETVLDRVTGLEWQRYLPLRNAGTWAQAEAYCSGLSLGGHDDWRMPTRVELDTLLDPRRAVVGVATDAFGSTLANRLLWSSTPSVTLPGKYIVVLLDGTSTAEDADDPSFEVRCLRWTSPPRSQAPRYSMRGTADEPITHDERTGLDWQRVVPDAPGGCAPTGISGRRCEHTQARAYCDGLSYGGHDDWRLPNIKEALTLFDPSRKGNLSEEGFGDPYFLSTWTSSEDPDTPGWMWTVQGEMYVTMEPIGLGDARCVR